MKTKIKVETITQQMFKVVIIYKGLYKNFYCTANSLEEAQKLAKEKCPNHEIGYAFECVDNWALC